MSINSLYLYPFRLSLQGEVVDGVMQAFPSFCRRQCNTKKCSDFYNSNCAKLGNYRCPYGFAVMVEKIGEKLITFTGLDVVGVSDKKEVQRRISPKEFVPRLSKSDYERMVEGMRSNFISLNEYYSQKHNTLLAADDYQSKIDTLDNTFHELRKLNGRLKASVERMIMSLDAIDFQPDAFFQKTAKDIFAASQLISIRLSTYDLILNPNSSFNYTKSPLAIYKKFDKVARLLDYQAQENGSAIIITGNSFCTYECSDIVELLPYLLLDNALKYSKQGEDVKLSFVENGKKLTIKITSFSQRPLDQELHSLFERGVRSKNVVGRINGQGIGLYLARYICEANGILINLSLGNRIETDKMGIKYSDFIVTLQFDGVE